VGVCVVCVWVCVSVCVGVCCVCLQMFKSVQMPKSMLRSVLRSVHKSSDQRTDAQSKHYITRVCDGHQCKHGFFFGVNLSDAHLENQHTEITFSANCLVGVVNAHSSFHLSVQRSQNFLVVDRDSAKGFEKQFVAFKKRSKLSSKNSSRKHVFGTSRGDRF
jgi:hypothetical protein